MFKRIVKVKDLLSIFLIFSFINLMQAQYLFPLQINSAQNNQSVQKIQNGISGILKDQNGDPVSDVIIVVTNEKMDILYGEDLSKNNPAGEFLITELPTAKELLIYAFHQDLPDTIGFQKIYLKNGQHKKIILELNKDLSNPEQIDLTFTNGKDDFLNKMKGLLSQSDYKKVAAKILSQFETAPGIRNPLKKDNSINKVPSKNEDIYFNISSIKYFKGDSIWSETVTGLTKVKKDLIDGKKNFRINFSNFYSITSDEKNWNGIKINDTLEFSSLNGSVIPESLQGKYEAIATITKDIEDQVKKQNFQQGFITLQMKEMQTLYHPKEITFQIDQMDDAENAEIKIAEIELKPFFVSRFGNETQIQVRGKGEYVYYKDSKDTLRSIWELEILDIKNKERIIKQNSTIQITLEKGPIYENNNYETLFIESDIKENNNPRKIVEPDNDFIFQAQLLGFTTEPAAFISSEGANNPIPLIIAGGLAVLTAADSTYEMITGKSVFKGATEKLLGKLVGKQTARLIGGITRTVVGSISGGVLSAAVQGLGLLPAAVGATLRGIDFFTNVASIATTIKDVEHVAPQIKEEPLAKVHKIGIGKILGIILGAASIAVLATQLAKKKQNTNTNDNNNITAEDLAGVWIATWDNNNEITLTPTSSSTFNGVYSNIANDNYFRGVLKYSGNSVTAEIKQYYSQGGLYGTYDMTTVTKTQMTGILTDYTGVYTKQVVWKKK